MKGPAFIVQGIYIERPSLGDVLKISNFLRVLRVSCVVQQFNFRPGLLVYLTGHRECTNAANIELCSHFKLNLVYKI
jgi:hypothetical protein